jgi:hypothetical protein
VKVAAMLDVLKADGWYVVGGKPSDELPPKTAASILWRAGSRG